MSKGTSADMSIDVCNETDYAVDELGLSEQASFILQRLHIHPAAELSIMLSDEVAMAGLHERFMHEPGATDVLSFPMDELRPGTLQSPTPEGVLGDVVLCPAFAERQAQTAGHSLAVELRLLLTHGILHLLGYDHAEPEEHKEMFSLQATLLAEWEGERIKRGFRGE